VDVAALDAAVSDHRHWLWEQWDIDGSGTLERNELLAKPQGLVLSVQTLFAPPKPAHPSAAPPPITNKEAWFDYWDSREAGGDGNGALDKEEVVRGLLKTLHSTASPARVTPARVTELRATIEAVWGIFDTDGFGTIERAEFLQADGLADTIVATLAQG